MNLSDQLLANVVGFLNDNIISFPTVEDCAAETVGLPRCVAGVDQDGEEIVGYCGRYVVTATLFIEAASEGAKALLTDGAKDLDAAFSSALFRQGCSSDGVVVDGVLQGSQKNNIEGEIWSFTNTITAFCHSIETIPEPAP